MHWDMISFEKQGSGDEKEIYKQQKNKSDEGAFLNLLYMNLSHRCKVYVV